MFNKVNFTFILIFFFFINKLQQVIHVHDFINISKIIHHFYCFYMHFALCFVILIYVIFILLSIKLKNIFICLIGLVLLNLNSRLALLILVELMA